jgi:rhodanese-related sulfurtransferase
MMESIDPVKLKNMMSDKEKLLLIDVREPYEHAAFNIGGNLIPMGEVFNRLNEIPIDKKVILYCQKGIRSVIVIQRLQQRYQYNNLINLTGGMDAWIKIFAS